MKKLLFVTCYHAQMRPDNAFGRVCLSVCLSVCLVLLNTLTNLTYRTSFFGKWVHIQNLWVMFIYQGHQVKVTGA